MPHERIVLGIDPGTSVLGYAIVKAVDSQYELLVAGVLDLQKYDDHYLKLKKIFDRLLSLVDEFKPVELAIEAPFFGKNVQSMLKLGRAQGVAMAACLHRSLPIFEYLPRKVKQSITGNGNATKEQVASLLIKILNVSELPTMLDATDAIAVSICHLFQNQSIAPTPHASRKGASSWKKFIAENQDRVVN